MKLSSNELAVIRRPPAIVGEPIGFSPKGKPIFRPTSLPAELWKVYGLGSFDSIRFARAVFAAPADEFFRHGVGSLEAIVDALSQLFSEGEFKLAHADSAMLEFSLTKTGSQVTKKHRQQLDELNQEFFIGGATDTHMKSADLSSPDSFVLGAP